MGSDPGPVPSLPAPAPGPENPAPGPPPRPMPPPPPDPPRPGLSPPEGDIARAPLPPLPGRPTFDPGWLETTTPEALPPLLLVGGGVATTASRAPPSPTPRLPLPWPVSEPPPDADGGGGITAVPVPIPPATERCAEPAPNWTVGGTTEVLPRPLMFWRAAEAFPTCTAGGTIWFCRSPGPQAGPVLATSEAMVGAGATTLGAGIARLGFTLVTWSGADTGGGTTCTAFDPGRRSVETSRWGTAALGGTAPTFNWGVARNWSGT